MTLHAQLSDHFHSAATDPVLVLLHGYGATERDLVGIVDRVWSGRWVALRAPLTLDSGGYAWFPFHAERIDPSGAVNSTGPLWQWLDENVDSAAALIPFGYSQGGLMAIQLLRDRPERVPAAVMLSGLVLDLPHPGDDALATSRPPAFYGRGDVDPVIEPALVDSASRWMREHTDLTEKVYPGLGHGVNEAELDDVRQFLQPWDTAAST